MSPVEYQETQPKSLDVENANLSITRRLAKAIIAENGSKVFQFSGQSLEVNGNGLVFTRVGLSNEISDRFWVTDGEVTITDQDKPGHTLILRYIPPPETPVVNITDEMVRRFRR